MSETINSIEEFISWTKQLEGEALVYRGLSDATWEVSASAYRRIEKSSQGTPPPPVFQNYIQQLLDNASLRGFRERQGKNHSDLELLAELQHHGAATCLIDFTTNALNALWFACRENPEKTGKVVAMPTDKIELFSIVSYQDLKKSIEEFLYKDKLWKWEPSHLSNRIVAQQSIFVFGRGKIEEALYKEVMIDGGSKEEIRDELRDRFGITEQYLFSDFTGFALSNAHDKSYTDYRAHDHFNLAMQFHQRGDFQKAIAAYDQAIKLNSPDNAIVYNNRGTAKHALGDYQGAIIDYDKAIKINPQYPNAYNNRGLAKHTLGDYHRAIADFDKAIEINPQYAIAYTNRGLSNAALGDYQGAVADHDKAIQINPEYSDAHSNRGVAKGVLGDHAGAILDFHNAILLNPRNAGIYHNMGDTKYKLNGYEEAIAYFDKAIEINPQFVEAYYSRGLAKSSLFDFQEAISDYDSAIKYVPQHVDAYFQRGIAKHQLKDYQGAISDYEKVIELNPKYSGASHNLEIARHESGNDAGAT